MKVALRIIDRKQRVTVGIIAAVNLTLVDEEPFNNADEDAGPAALLAINALRAVLPPIPVAVRSKIRLDEASIVNVIRQRCIDVDVSCEDNDVVGSLPLSTTDDRRLWSMKGQ